MFPGQVETRETFLARLEGKGIPETAIYRIEQAYDTAKHALQYGVRKGEFDAAGNPIRLLEHSRAVTLVLLDRIGCYKPPTICVALLHDTVEDGRYVTVPRIRTWFNSRKIAEQVGLLTKGPEYKRSKKSYIDNLYKRVREGYWEETLVKLCDRAANMETLENCSVEFQRKQADETRDAYIPLFEELIGILPAKYRSSTEAVLSDIKSLTTLYETPA
jgi:(p)ppGpp synthase/HD superfamily hydrolase